MNNIRMQIAVGATILGLGGLAGYAVSSNGAQTPATVSAAAAHPKPKVHTQVVHRTIRPDPKKSAKDAAGASPPPSAAPPAPAPAASAPVAPAPAPTATPVSAPSSQPVSTHTSGGGGGARRRRGRVGRRW